MASVHTKLGGQVEGQEMNQEIEEPSETSPSIRVASAMSDEALRNSRMLLPRAAPTSGKRPGPMITSAMIRMTMSSGAPMFGIGSGFDLDVVRRPARGQARWLG